MTSKGFVYYSVGEAYIGKAVRSIRSLKNFTPDSSITVFTDSPSCFSREGVQTVPVLPRYNKADRINLLVYSPYEHTLYVDSDTLFMGDCSSVFEIISNHQICMTISHLAVRSNLNLPAELPFFNSGIIGYRLTADVQWLFNVWQNEMQNALLLDPAAKDEPVLQAVLFELDLWVEVLPKVYNYRITQHTKLPTRDGIKIVQGSEDALVVAAVDNRSQLYY